MLPTDSPDEYNGFDLLFSESGPVGFDPLFSESGPIAEWDLLGMAVEGNGEDEEEMLGGGLIEELR
jgi:hypothetical protein